MATESLNRACGLVQPPILTKNTGAASTCNVLRDAEFKRAAKTESQIVMLLLIGPLR
jgi:hypothetical protein